MPDKVGIVEELSVLAHYHLDSSQEGLKIHSSAKPGEIE
jgi:hypothetical protein